MAQLRHLLLLIDQFEYMGEVAHRLSDDTTPQMKKSFKSERDPKIKEKKYQAVQDIKKFLELYQTYNIKDYDYWDHQNAPVFSLFVDKFETEA